MNDHEAIRRLIALYAQRLDDGDFEGMGALFTEDAEFVSVPPPAPDGAPQPFWRAAGRGSIVSSVAGSMSPILAKGRCIHLCSEPAIDIEGAHASAVWDFVVVRTIESVPGIGATGRYYAQFAEVNGSWRFARRIALQGNATMPEAWKHMLIQGAS